MTEKHVVKSKRNTAMPMLASLKGALSGRIAMLAVVDRLGEDDADSKVSIAWIGLLPGEEGEIAKLIEKSLSND